MVVANLITIHIHNQQHKLVIVFGMKGCWKLLRERCAGVRHMTSISIFTGYPLNSIRHCASPLNFMSIRQFTNHFSGISPVDIEKELISIKRLMGAHHSQGRYAKALEVAIELQMKIEDSIGKDNVMYASALNNVGLMSKLTNDVERAIEVYTEALTIYEELSGKMSRSYMITLGNLGAAYRTLGEHTTGVKREYLLERAMEALGDVYTGNENLLGQFVLPVIILNK